MYNYKIGDKFRWKEGKCFMEDYSDDIYELAQKDNGDYYVKTIYSFYNDYEDWDEQGNKTKCTCYDGSYEEICERIDKDLEKIED